MKTLYVCGPMAGLAEHNFPAFFDAEEKLRQLGYLVNNPASLQPGPPMDAATDEGWAWCLKRDIPYMLMTDGLALLPGWQNSRGAKLEVMIATSLFMPTWDYRDGILHEPGNVPPLDALGDLPVPSSAGGV